MGDAHLQWIHYNRGEPGARPAPPVESKRTERLAQWEAARRGATVSAGQVARQTLESRARLSALERRLLHVLEEEGGTELVNEVMTVGLRRGVLRIETGSGVAAYSLRLRWEQRLLRAVQRRLPEAGVRAVRFVLMNNHD